MIMDMDNDLVLNIATDVQASQSKGPGKKGGRWTDRLKAKRVSKRKFKHEENGYTTEQVEPRARPVKRHRVETPVTSHIVPSTSHEHAPKNLQPHTQVISSLFSYNPTIEKLVPSITPKPQSAPSNAPLANSSTFVGLGLDPLIVAHLSSKMNIDAPTSIQRAALPALLSPASEDSRSRDVFIQSQTGSGKTLSFLLPIIQDLLPLSTHSYIDRSIGTLAIIITPTRELAKQISEVLDVLLRLRLRPSDELPHDANSSTRLTRWLVSGLLTGGATRTHEKARLRKGLPILVSTPGRLLDHLQNTSSFNVGKCRWLVLDEADRLMELGFEETITGIIQGLDGRRKLSLQAVQEGKSMEVGGWDWQHRRRTVLCSATIRDDVRRLAGITLIRPVMIKAMVLDKPSEVGPGDGGLRTSVSSSDNFTPPSQLSQKYVIVPLKLRLVALVALLRSLLSQFQSGRRGGSKIIVFLSCTDSVDFHWRLLGGSSMEKAGGGEAPASSRDSNSDGIKNPGSPIVGERVEVKCSLLPDTSIFRLHGLLPTPTRLASLRGFSAVPSTKSNEGTPTSSILLCTSVASRGLDLPLVRAVVQYDLPTEGGATEYIHRVGRTARVGKGGEAWSLVAPSEAGWVSWVENGMRSGAGAGGGVKVGGDDGGSGLRLEGVTIESVLGRGFGGRGDEYEERATEVQLSFERWVLSHKEHAKWARKAFLSHMRAYATHPSNEKHIFHIRHLHIGHLAKAFALREAPKSVTAASSGTAAKLSKKGDAVIKVRAKGNRGNYKLDKKSEKQDEGGGGDAERRMKDVVRSQGRLSKAGGVMVSTGTSEFQIAAGYALEKLVGSKI